MNQIKYTATKKQLDEVYAIGFRNGGLEMRNKILKTLNRDWKFWGFRKVDLDLCVKVLKKISRISPPTPPLT